MEIILSVLFLVGIWVYFKVQDGRACNYSQSHKIDWGKVNEDRAVNDLSNLQVNQNMLNGKYNASATRNKSSNDTWEDFKKKASAWELELNMENMKPSEHNLVAFMVENGIIMEEKMNKQYYKIIKEFNCHGKHMIAVKIGNAVHVMDYSDWQLIYGHNHQNK